MLGTYAGAHIGADQMIQAGIEAGRQAPAAIGWLVGLGEGMRALVTHYLPWAVGMGTAGGGLGAAIGFALTEKGGTEGAPLAPPKEST